MGSIFWFLVAIGGGLVAGWIFLPEPKFIREFFVRIGWASPKV